MITSLKKLALVAALILIPHYAIAAGGGGGGGSGGGSSGGNGSSNSYQDEDSEEEETNVPTCKKGFVYSQKKNACVKMGSEFIPDQDLYQQGRALALNGDYENAFDLLSAIKRTDDAMVYTMLGFTTRKLGRWDEGMAIYKKALAIDPSNPNTHEYIGEAYIAVGRFDLASLQLSEVEKGCGNRNCYQYKKLSVALASGVIQ